MHNKRRHIASTAPKGMCSPKSSILLKRKSCNRSHMYPAAHRARHLPDLQAKSSAHRTRRPPARPPPEPSDSGRDGRGRTPGMPGTPARAPSGHPRTVGPPRPPGARTASAQLPDAPPRHRSWCSVQPAPGPRRGRLRHLLTPARPGPVADVSPARQPSPRGSGPGCRRRRVPPERRAPKRDHGRRRGRPRR